MMIDGFGEVPDSNYDSIREMERAVAGISTVSKKARNGKSVSFGIIPRDNPRIMYEKFQPLLDYLSSETPYSYELVLKRNYEETVDALATGETDRDRKFLFSLSAARRGHVPFTVVFFQARNIPVADSRNQLAAW